MPEIYPLFWVGDCFAPPPPTPLGPPLESSPGDLVRSHDTETQSHYQFAANCIIEDTIPRELATAQMPHEAHIAECDARDIPGHEAGDNYVGNYEHHCLISGSSELNGCSRGRRR